MVGKYWLRVEMWLLDCNFVALMDGFSRFICDEDKEESELLMARLSRKSAFRHLYRDLLRKPTPTHILRDEYRNKPLVQ